MIGSVGSIGGSVGGQSLERAARRASGRYVEAAERASADSDNQRSFALVDPRAETGSRTGHRSTAPSANSSASAPFVAQLAALGLGDAGSGERRVRRDPLQIVARADALYRDGYRRVTDLEPGFFGTAEY